MHIVLHIMHIVHHDFAYYAYWTYLLAYCMRMPGPLATPLAMPRAIHIMHIFSHIMQIVFHIYWHILHIGSMTHSAYSAYLFTWTYCFNNLHIKHNCILSILCISFYIGHILHILHILCASLISVSFVVYSHYCLAPHPRAQLFTYHHLHPSPLFWLLSQEAPEKSADVPFSPTGTTGRRPSMELTGMKYNTCACPLRS